MNTFLSYVPRHFFSFPVLFCFFLINAIILGFLIPRLMAYLPAISGLCLSIIYLLKEKKFFNIDKSVFLFLIGITSWITLSAIWSFNSEFSVERSIKVALILFPAFLFWSIAPKIIIENINQFAKVAICIFSALILFLTIEKYFDHPVTELFLNQEVQPHKSNRSFVILALLATPFLFLVKKTNWPQKKLIELALIIVVGTALTQTISQTAQLSFIIGLIFIYLIPPSKILIKCFFIGLIILTIALPFSIKPIKNAITPEAMKGNSLLREASIVHRFEIWEHSVNKAFEKPLLGNGIESLRFMTADQWMPNQRSDQALHSHNFILQLWVEFGATGAFMMIAFFILSLRKMLHVQDLNQRKLYFATYAATVSCALTGYGFWQSWHLGFIMLLATLVLFIANQNQQITKT